VVGIEIVIFDFEAAVIGVSAATVAIGSTGTA
jgi:hypothetical protein